MLTYELFSKFNIAGKKPKLITRIHSKTKKESVSYRFYTKCQFQQFRSIFYPNGSKVIPKNINKFSAETLAIWFMDDGGRGAPLGQIISVCGFNTEEQELLKKCLLDNFNLEVTLYRNGRIYIPIKSVESFHSLVSPFVIPSMRYKLSITP